MTALYLIYKCIWKVFFLDFNEIQETLLCDIWHNHIQTQKLKKTAVALKKKLSLDVWGGTDIPAISLLFW